MRATPLRIVSVLTLAAGTVALTPATQTPEPILGFTAENAARQHELEARFDRQLDPGNLRAWMKRITAKPFYLGSPHDKENADFVASLFRDWGYDVTVEEYQVLFPTPKVRELELVAPTRYTARLREPEVEGDATSGITDHRLPTYNAYSADGDVTGELVYVNYGIPDDYEELERRGIDVKGKIVIARYGGSWRGIKPKVAAEHGAIATILYSDPRDDGYYEGDTYPEGPYRMKWGVQRGSVEDMPLYPGDPLTPGVGATADAERMTREESPVIMKIPVLPISWGDAQPLLEAMGGPVAPASWRGALPLTYHLGPGPARVHLHLEFDWSLTPAYDVIARLEGSELPDEWVVRGNHRDGWALGASDPTSGQVAMLEEARTIGTLAAAGWRPRRTIVFASWDGEEPGLLGSTEWAEDHAAELRDKAVLYINTDGSGRGFLRAGGSHTLERFVNQVARDVKDPQTGVSVLRRARAREAVDGDPDALGTTDLSISPLGSGSDYTPFLQHLGVASLNLGYGGENGGGSYHSMFDSFDHYVRFGDPGFVYGVTLAKTTGRVTLRAADADFPPLRFTNFSDHVKEYVGQVKELLEDSRKETVARNRLVKEKAYELAADPTETYVPPEARDEVPYLNFAPLENAATHLEEASAAVDAALAKATDDPEKLARAGADLDEMLMATERLMTREDGLPRREWFKHQIYAPGFYTGYGVKTLPGVREAIEQRRWDEANDQIVRVAGVLERVAGVLEEASKLLEGS